MEDFLPVATTAWEAERQSAREAAEREEQAKKLRLQQETEAKERETYLRLQEKYGEKS